MPLSTSLFGYSVRLQTHKAIPVVIQTNSTATRHNSRTFPAAGLLKFLRVFVSSRQTPTPTQRPLIPKVRETKPAPKKVFVNNFDDNFAPGQAPNQAKTLCPEEGPTVTLVKQGSPSVSVAGLVSTGHQWPNVNLYPRSPGFPQRSSFL